VKSSPLEEADHLVHRLPAVVTRIDDHRVSRRRFDGQDDPPLMSSRLGHGSIVYFMHSSPVKVRVTLLRGRHWAAASMSIGRASQVAAVSTPADTRVPKPRSEMPARRRTAAMPNIATGSVQITGSQARIPRRIPR